MTNSSGRSRIAAAAGLLATLVAGLPAQTTHVVGPSGHPTIDAAIAVATPGDIVHVQPGTYPSFSANKALTIRAVTPGTVTIGGIFNLFQLPTRARLHIVGIAFGAITTVIGGHSTFDGCVFAGRGEVLVAQSGTAHLQDCTVTSTRIFTPAPPAAMRAWGAYVTATGCTFQGGDGVPTFGMANAAFRVQNSTLHASHCTFAGGAGNLPASAISADASSTIWLSDSTLTCDPALCPIDAPGTSGRQARLTLVPNCGALPTGPLLGASRPSALSPGTPFTLQFLFTPNEPIGVFANLEVGYQTGPPFEQADMLAGGWPAAMLSASAIGLATAIWNIPNNAALVDRAVWLQGFAGLTGLVQTSPVVGGILR